MEKRAIQFSPPDIIELEINEVVETLCSGWITTGPRTKMLEYRLAAYFETGKTDIDCTTKEAIAKYSHKVVCLNSATAAEELNFRILGVGPGDEVIVPAYSYTASASAAIHCGATVKFVDIQKDGDPTTHCPEMDYDALEAAITEKTKAIVPVDLGGIVCDYNRIFEVVERTRNMFKPMDSDGTSLSDLSAAIQRGLGCVAVVSDCAHSLGASRMVFRAGEGNLDTPERRYCGRIAHFSSFSFHAVKNYTTGEGGASTWCLPGSVYAEGVTDKDIYKFYQLLSLHGQDKDAFAKKVGAWEYDIIGPWYKCNMTDIMAAIGLRQLDRYPGLLERRESIMKVYDKTCDELGIGHMIHHTDIMDSSNHLYLIRIPSINAEQRNEIIEKMAERGVATNVHYKPMPMMTAYKTLGWDIKDFPNTYDYYHNLITLPFHTLLSDDDVIYVCETLQEVVNEIRE
ncbi:MAG: DegT/DnrJ/EryC1/StrS family aminotransferase [Saccharofermentanales bacterium]|jgi:dTDP-4-amino-4,6-dideoxygalactose transaminase